MAFSPIFTIAVEPGWREVLMVERPWVAIAEPSFMPLTLKTIISVPSLAPCTVMVPLLL